MFSLRGTCQFSNQGQNQRQRDIQVEALRKQGYTVDAMVQKLNVSKNTVQRSINRLVKAGRIEPKARPHEEVIVFDANIKQLRNEGYDNAAIKAVIGKQPKNRMRSTLHRLANQGRIETNTSEGVRERFISALLEHAQKYPGRNVNLSAIARQLKISRERARQLYDKLAANNENFPLKNAKRTQKYEILCCDPAA